MSLQTDNKACTACTHYTLVGKKLTICTEPSVSGQNCYDLRSVGAPCAGAVLWVKK